MPSDNTKVEVIQFDSGYFEATPMGAMGSPTAGHGSSVLEAVGEYAINHGLVHVVCKPPGILNEYEITNEYSELNFRKPRSRDD